MLHKCPPGSTLSKPVNVENIAKVENTMKLDLDCKIVKEKQDTKHVVAKEGKP